MVNLPRAHKMMPPRYQEIPPGEIPRAALPGGTSITVICGTAGGITGPVRDIVSGPEYFDVACDPDVQFSLAVQPGRMAAVYVIGGSGRFDPHRSGRLGNRMLALFRTDGDSVEVRAGSEGIRFLYISGKPLREPIAWGGPIVMNTDQELQQAFDEYEHGMFIRKNS